MMMTLIKLPDNKYEYVNDLDDLINISNEYIGYDFSKSLEVEIEEQIVSVKEEIYDLEIIKEELQSEIETVKEEIYDLEVIKEELQSDKDELDNLIISIRTRLEKLSDNIDKISMDDVLEIVDDILTDI